MQGLKKKLKNMLIALVLLLAGAGLGFLVIEFGLRLALFGSLQWRQSGYLPFIRAPHPELGWLTSPNQVAAEEDIEYQHLITTNDRGLRDRERSYEKPPDIFRIVVLGDSYIEATHVPEGQGYTQALEELLANRGVEVINMGVGGYATTAAWLYLQSEGLKYAPDLVLLGFFAENDVHDNSPELSRIFWGSDNVRYYGQPYAVWNEEAQTLEIIPPDFERSYKGYQERLDAYSPGLYQLDALQKSLASRLFQKMRYQMRARVRTPGYDVNIHFGCYMRDFLHLSEHTKASPETYQRLWDDAWFVTEKLLVAMHKTARAHDAKFAFFNAPSRIQFEAQYKEAVDRRFPCFELDPDLPERRIGAFAEKEGIPFLNMLPAFRQAVESGHTLNYNHDSHWNAAGHRLAATVTAAFLEEAGLLPAAQ